MALSSYTVNHSPELKQFFIEFDDGTRALLDYQEESPKVYEFYHTETPVHMRGKGIASIVSTSAMEWIQSNNYKAHLTCSYLKGDFLAKNPQWIDWVKID
jgi:hypothetical protein